MVANVVKSDVKKSVKNRRRSMDLTVSSRLESCIGCKWTLRVLAEVRNGVRRPGAIVRSVPGLTTKVLNERLTKLSRFGVIERRSYPEIPPRVEYNLTQFGKKFVKILDAIERLELEGRKEADRE
jgi:DNA-binding HxlR family transcriptional regulator